MRERVYWIWLSLCFQVGSKKLHDLVAEMNAATFWEKKEELREKFPFLDARDWQKINTIKLGQAEAIVQECEALGISIVTYGDEWYPESLRHIFGAPAVLYYKGSWQDFSARLVISVVGTRRSTPYYQSVTGNLCYRLAHAGTLIVSGCAVGIDTYAHRGAVKAKKPTVAVLACGIDVDYPIENRTLKEEILECGGMLISELPPRMRVERDYFRVRNRLISGLADGVLLTQAPMRSGSLITAEHAGEQGKHLFCTPPADLFDSSCMGVAGLIRDGAKIVFGANDILEDFTQYYPELEDCLKDYNEDFMLKNAPPPTKKEKPKTAAKEPQAPKQALPVLPPDDLTDMQKAVFAVLEIEPKHIDELLQITGLKIQEIMSTMTDLELLGLAESCCGRQYKKCCK